MKKKFNLINFQFGRKIRDIYHYVKVGSVLMTTIDVLSYVPGLTRRKVFNAIDVTQLKLNIEVLNDYIIKDNELIGYRVDRVIDEALKEYNDEI